MSTPYATPTQADVDRFWSKVERTPGCWLWTGSLFASGYGAFAKYGGAHYAHRIAYELVSGPIPPTLQIDHLCYVRACVNPAHLEAVTASENQRRAAERRRRLGITLRRRSLGSGPGIPLTLDTTVVEGYCLHGHPRAGNTYVDKRGLHLCRPCRREKGRLYLAANREREAARMREYRRRLREEAAA